MALRGEPIGDDDLAEVLTRVAAVEEFVPDRPSYFEILTAAAFDWFAEEAVDVAVVEVGRRRDLGRHQHRRRPRSRS